MEHPARSAYPEQKTEVIAVLLFLHLWALRVLGLVLVPEQSSVDHGSTVVERHQDDCITA